MSSGCASTRSSRPATPSSSRATARTPVGINTAIALQMEHDRKVVLVDAALQFGDHRVFLDLGNDRKSIIDAVSAPNVDAELLKSVLVKHDSGIDLLLAPASPEESDL